MGERENPDGAEDPVLDIRRKASGSEASQQSVSTKFFRPCLMTRDALDQYVG